MIVKIINLILILLVLNLINCSNSRLLFTPLDKSNETILIDSKLIGGNDEKPNGKPVEISDSILRMDVHRPGFATGQQQQKEIHHQITNLCEETLSSWSGRLFTKLIRALYNTRTWSSQQEDQSEMRGKQAKYSKVGSAVAAAIVSGSFMTLITLAVLAAMAGKALVASLLAVVLAGVTLWQSGNGPNNDPAQGVNTLEIIARPVYRQPTSHHDYHNAHH